jgi:hypothetical protein
MLTRVCLTTIALLVTMPAWSQALPTATTGTGIPDEYRMPIPPMASGQAFPTTPLSETRSNYLDGGLSFQPAYYDNLLPGNGAHPTSDMSYSIRPTIELDRLTPRLHQAWAYHPGFTIYQKTSARNEADQSASLALQYRLSEHTTVSGQNNFLRSSNVFSQPYSLTGGPISGSPPSSPADVIAPFVDRLTNTANAEVAYQFSMNGMVGAGGTTSMFNYPNQSQSSNLYNSNSRGGSAFYNHRLFGTQYIGITYQYLRILGNPQIGQLKIQTHTIFPFYTAFLGHAFSLSLAAGPQYFSYAQSPFPTSQSWTPSVMESVGWQTEHTSLAASYSRSVTGGGGLLGAKSSNSASASVTWRITRTWDVGSTAGYAIYKNASPLSLSPSLGGHSVSGTVTIDHTLSERLRMEVGYQRLHQSYSGIAAITSDPDADREFASISYQFTRPLGR